MVTNLCALEEFHRVTDGIAPGIGLRVEIVIHGRRPGILPCLPISLSVLRNAISSSHHFGPAKD